MSTQFRIRPILRRAGRLEDAAVRAQLRIRPDARRAILARMVDAGAFDRFRLTLLLQAIDIEIMQGTAAAQRAIAGATEQAFGLGQRFSWIALGTSEGLVGISRELVRAVVFVTTDQVRDVWGELGSRLKLIIRRAALGVTDPFEAMKSLARVIRDPKTFGRAFWRAETIVRTEVGRAFQIASQDELERATMAGVEVRKYWLTAHDERVRDTHRQAGLDYVEANAIVWDGLFKVGADELRYPKDPNGSAGETINCRCVSVPVVIADRRRNGEAA
jgi:hypothetical protein